MRASKQTVGAIGRNDSGKSTLLSLLTVVDNALQEKSGPRYKNSKRGKTVFVVSQDKRVSDRVLWIDNHVLCADGPKAEVIKKYERTGRS
jgi:ABC-type polysaccharide/polyol phosphate transport system ATPase subunit